VVHRHQYGGERRETRNIALPVQYEYEGRLVDLCWCVYPTVKWDRKSHTGTGSRVRAFTYLLRLFGPRSRGLIVGIIILSHIDGKLDEVGWMMGSEMIGSSFL